MEPYARCLVHLGLGDHDRALDCLERAYEDRSWQLVWLGVVADLRSAPTDPTLPHVDGTRRLGVTVDPPPVERA